VAQPGGPTSGFALHLVILYNYINKTDFSFSFIVKAAASQQQISKFYPHRSQLPPVAPPGGRGKLPPYYKILAVPRATTTFILVDACFNLKANLCAVSQLALGARRSTLVPGGGG